MPIVGERPESGVRLVVSRSGSEEGPWTYTGAAFLPDATFELAIRVGVDGLVSVEPAASGDTVPADLSEKIRLIVRTAYKQAKADGEPPPLRIARWRGDK